MIFLHTWETFVFFEVQGHFCKKCAFNVCDHSQGKLDIETLLQWATGKRRTTSSMQTLHSP